MNSISARRRTRMGSDAAHTWARNLRLGNPYAKSVLLALTLYVNDEGSCFAGIGSLADDTDLSEDTVRKRLRWLEEIGAIARFARFRDENGCVNTEGRGKRTTDDIRLLIESDPEDIEARAAGLDRNAEDVGHAVASALDPVLAACESEFSPRCQQGLNQDQKSVSPRLAPEQPSHCSNPSKDSSEPEPEESPPTPPSGGVCADDQENSRQEAEPDPEHFAEFFEACHGWRTQDRGRVRQAFVALTPDERVRARAAAPLYAAECDRTRKKSRDAWKLIREKFWINFPDAKLPQRPPPLVWIDAAETDGLAVALDIADGGPLKLITDTAGRRGLWRRSPVPTDLAALARFAGVARDDWPIIAAGSHEFAAWRDRLEAWTGLRVEGRRVFVEPRDPNVHDLPPTHPAFRLRRSVIALRVPTRWPPRRDGAFADDDAAA